MGVADQTCEIGSADVLVRLARNFVSGRIRDQSGRAAANAPMVTAGLDRLGGSARGDACLRVSIAQLFPALIRATPMLRPSIHCWYIVGILGFAHIAMPALAGEADFEPADIHEH